MGVSMVRCGDCRFYLNEHGLFQQECRRYPAIIRKGQDEWCGEFRPVAEFVNTVSETERNESVTAVPLPESAEVVIPSYEGFASSTSRESSVKSEETSKDAEPSEPESKPSRVKPKRGRPAGKKYKSYPRNDK